MIAASNRVSTSPLILAGSALAVSVISAVLIARLPISATTILTGGILVVLIGLLHTRLVIYLIIFSMLLSPELGMGMSAGDRQVTIRLEDLLLILVGVAWLARAVYRKGLGLLKNSPLNAPIAAFSAAAILATLTSGLLGEINWARALLFLVKYLEYFVLYFLVLNNVRSRSDIKSYLVAALATCAIVSVVGIAQIPSGSRVSAPFEGEVGEPNTFGGYLVFMLALISAFYLTASSLRERLLWLAFGGVIVLPLLYTLSRSSWLSAGAMVLALLWLAPRKGHLLAGGVILLVLSPLLLPHQVVGRIAYTFEQPPAPGQIRVGQTRLDTSSSARIRSWQRGLEGWSRRPLTGHGVAGYEFMDAQYVRILTETGLLGLAAFAWLALNIFRMALARLRKAQDRFETALSLGYLAGFVALLVHGIGANTFIIIRIMEPFWLVTALVVALPDTRRSAEDGQEPTG
jgi:O-antigen ligase